MSLNRSTAEKHREAMRWLDAHVDYAGDECLIWPGSRSKGGYGKLRLGGRYTNAHRVMCEAAHGAPPSPRHMAAHSCGRGHEGCVNPRHLRWATQAENLADRYRHGTDRRGVRHPMVKLTESDVIAIRRACAAGQRGTDVAAEYGVTPTTVCRIKNRRGWAHLEDAA